MQVVAMLRLFQLSMWLTDDTRDFFHIFPFSCRRLKTAFESPDILISSVLSEAALCLSLGYWGHVAVRAVWGSDTCLRLLLLSSFGWCHNIISGCDGLLFSYRSVCFHTVCSGKQLCLVLQDICLSPLLWMYLTLLDNKALNGAWRWGSLVPQLCFAIQWLG